MCRIACAVIGTGLVAVGCEAMGDVVEANRELRERYGVEETSIHVERGGGLAVVTVEATDPEASGGGEVEERIRGMASIAAEAFELAEDDSVVVSLSTGSDGGESGARATVTTRYEVVALDPAGR